MPSRVAVLGAHTAVARALLEHLQERELEVEVSRLTVQEHLEPGLDPITPEAIAAADLLILAMKGPIGAVIAADARLKKKLLLDLTGELEDVEYVWPFFEKVRSTAKIPAIAPGLAGPIAALLRALLPAISARSIHVATYESAAILDREGVDGLSEEVRSIFTLKEIEQPVFGERLAFNAIAAADANRDPFAEDDRMSRQIALGAGTSVPISLTRVLIPSFSGEGAAISVAVDQPAAEEAVLAAISGAKGLRLKPGRPASASDAIGRDDALVSRIRVESDRINLWIVADRLTAGSATPATLFIEQWLAGGLA